MQLRIIGWLVVFIMNVSNGCRWESLVDEWYRSWMYLMAALENYCTMVRFCWYLYFMYVLVPICCWLLCSVLWGFYDNHGIALCQNNIKQYNPKQQKHILPVHFAVSTVQLWFWTRSSNAAKAAMSDHEHLKQLPSTASGGSDDIDDDDPCK